MPLFSVGREITMIDQLKKYQATVKLRHNANLGAVRPEMNEYDGVTATFRPLWIIDCREDEYANRGYDQEWAMECPQDWPIIWIASGDLINIKEM